MKQKTNGKIVIAILAMFAVALSIVGFTYAYFTATFNVNPEDKSVVVNAGKLVANFEGKNNIDFTGIVPGWISNGLSYYDSNVALGGVGHIYATELTYEDTTDAGGNVISATYPEYYGPTATELSKLSYESKGLTQPIKFTVSNDKNSPDKVSFIVRLTNINNGIYTMANGRSTEKMSEKADLTQDIPNLKVHLYEGTFDPSKKSESYGGTHISTLVLGYNEDNDTTKFDEIFTISGTKTESTDTRNVTNIVAPLSTQILSVAPHTLDACVDNPAATGEDDKRICGASTTKDFFVMFEYANEPTWEQLAQGASFGARVEIIGIQKDNDPGVNTWYDADNAAVTFAKSRS